MKNQDIITKEELRENGLKKCACCGKILPFESFAKNNQQKDGRSSYCNECANEKVKESQTKTKFDDVIGWRASQMTYQANHNYDKGRLETETVKDMMIQHLIENDGKCPRCNRTYNLVASEKANQSTISIDHIIPKSKGGTNTYDNIQFMCNNCNERKKNKIED